MGVGTMLTSFGLFWVGEGSGVHWPGGDLSVLGFVGIFALVTLGAVAGLRRAVPNASLAGEQVAG
jgi:uncharacterized membrane protein